MTVGNLTKAQLEMIASIGPTVPPSRRIKEYELSAGEQSTIRALRRRGLIAREAGLRLTEAGIAALAHKQSTNSKVT